MMSRLKGTSLFKNDGFTLSELMVSVGVTAILGLISVTVMLNLTKNQNALSRTSDDIVLSEIGNRYISLDLARSAPSFNVLLPTADPSDQSGNPSFFDYYPDVPANVLSPVARDFTLSLSGKKNFYILTQDPAGPVMFYNPVAAYSVGTQPNPPTTAAPLKYLGINTNSYLSNLNVPSGCTCPSAGCSCPYWASGKLLFLDTPAYLRPLGPSGNVINMSTVPPRSPVFIGVVGNTDISADTYIKTLVFKTDPITGTDLTTGAAGGADAFLRAIPSVGGGSPIVRLRTLNLVLYSIAVSPTNPNVGQLFRSTYVGGTSAFSTPIMIADNVKSVVFHRDSVLQQFVYYQINSL
jgi:type II secretory pathway pseudopilin PulG